MQFLLCSKLNYNYLLDANKNKLSYPKIQPSGDKSIHALTVTTDSGLSQLML